MVEHTPDGHHIVVGGRRWRATDPSIPDKLRAEMVAELMEARRGVKDATGDDGVASARARVQDAKVALGERGEPWWDEPTSDGLRTRVAATIRTLLRHRGADKTICPSDAARAVGGDRWRTAVPVAQQVAAELHREGVVEVRQKGERVDPAAARGPVRLARGTGFPAPPDG